MLKVGVHVAELYAMHDAVLPPFKPLQLHVHGPLPATVEAPPEEQRFVVGAEETAVPFVLPHAPLTGLGLEQSASAEQESPPPPETDTHELLWQAR